MSSFSDTLRRLRFERHMTQEEFAELLGTTKQNISRYESGAVSPKISTAAIMADKLGISLSELTGDPYADMKAYSDAKVERLRALGQQLTAPSRSTEWRMLSEGLAKMERENKPAFQALLTFLTTTYPENFSERNDDDDTES